MQHPASFIKTQDTMPTSGEITIQRMPRTDCDPARRSLEQLPNQLPRIHDVFNHCLPAEHKPQTCSLIGFVDDDMVHAMHHLHTSHPDLDVHRPGRPGSFSQDHYINGPPGDG